jgi:hypothetical protein
VVRASAAVAGVECRAAEDGDELDQELARRLNARLADGEQDADYNQSMAPVFRAIAYWCIATACLVAASLLLL